MSAVNSSCAVVDSSFVVAAVSASFAAMVDSLFVVAAADASSSVVAAVNASSAAVAVDSSCAAAAVEVLHTGTYWNLDCNRRCHSDRLLGSSRTRHSSSHRTEASCCCCCCSFPAAGTSWNWNTWIAAAVAAVAASDAVDDDHRTKEHTACCSHTVVPHDHGIVHE